MDIATASFSVKERLVLNEDGELEQNPPEFVKDKEFVLMLYTRMVETRVFDQKAVSLQRTGKMGTYASTHGQESFSVGYGAAMHTDDVLCPYYRDYGAQLFRGTKMHEILQYWGGDERGMCYKENHDLPISVPIASQTLHAAGVAASFKYRKQKRVAVATLGDGATSRGDFYESMNCAGAWQLPVLYIINNNRWAISVPLHMQTHTKTLAQKAIAAEIPCMQVDGFDVLAMYDVTAKALERIRAGKGPFLIEAIGYRMCDHTTADDASRYQPAEERAHYEAKDPLKRLKSFLMKHHGFTQADDEQLWQEVKKLVDAEAEIYLATEPAPARAMFDHLYAEIPASYERQLAQLEE